MQTDVALPRIKTVPDHFHGCFPQYTIKGNKYMLDTKHFLYVHEDFQLELHS